MGIKQELDYLAPDGELDLKVNLSKAKDKQAADLVLQNLQAVDNMLSAELPVLEHLRISKATRAGTSRIGRDTKRSRG